MDSAIPVLLRGTSDGARALTTSHNAVLNTELVGLSDTRVIEPDEVEYEHGLERCDSSNDAADAVERL